jgi:heavy metal sensor kinase
MTLTARLSWFSLGALAVVLAGFSMCLYLLARTYLYRQAEDRLEATLNTLVAAAEIEPAGLAWEPEERHLSLGRDAANGLLQWAVTDPASGRRVDGSAHPALDEFLAHAGDEADQPVEVTWQGQPWWVKERYLRSMPHPNAPAPAAPPDGQGQPEPRYHVLRMTAGVSLEPVRANLRNLALALAGISAALWLLAAVAGRFLGRRALLPVTRMAAAAQAMSAADRDQRLPTPGTGDELDELGQAFNGLLDRLHESFERQRRFTGDASHQLRTPLTAMLGQVEVALRRPRPPEEYQRVLTAVHDQALHLRRIVEMLLFLARADAEARLPDLETIDLAAWLEEHLRTWSGHARAADLRRECTPADPFTVSVQTPLLGQLVDNLLENACKYSQRGTPITCRLETEKGLVMLTVADQGCGIPAVDLPHVFEPFYRSAQARQLGLGGVGLGLAVAQRIASAFGGSLSVESTVGQGSRFSLRLPPAQPASAATPEP